MVIVRKGLVHLARDPGCPCPAQLSATGLLDHWAFRATHLSHTAGRDSSADSSVRRLLKEAAQEANHPEAFGLATPRMGLCSPSDWGPPGLGPVPPLNLSSLWDKVGLFSQTWDPYQDKAKSPHSEWVPLRTRLCLSPQTSHCLPSG